jgi:membrane protease YdiL (CAAX protease family)
MTAPPEFDPDNPKAIPPAAEPQPWKDDEGEIPSFEGMVFSSFVDPADLTGAGWESAQPMPEMPLTIWEDPPLTEDEVLKVIATSSQKSMPAEGNPDAPEESEAAQDDTVKPADADSDWLVTPAALAETLPAVEREPLNGSHRGLYGNLADSSWLTLEKLRPVQGLPGEEYVAQTPFYTKESVELSLAAQAADPQKTAQDVQSAEETEEKLQPAPLSPEANPSPSEPSHDASLAPVATAEVSRHDAQPELIDAVIPILRERPLFHSWYEPEPKAPDPIRIPHFVHLVILVLIAFVGLVGAILLMRGALDLHMFGVSTVQQASSDIHYTIGFMASMYLISFALAWFIFPLIWHKSLFAGLQWNFASTWRPRRMLILLSAAFLCFLLAMVDELVLPGPANAPIDKLFDSRTAAWLLFAFGVTFAPFFEEIVFRGFLLPALCTAFDWYGEKLTGNTAPPLEAGDHPHWSLFAMILGSIATSIPFALMHAEQTAWSLGPFLLLVAVSLVLCWARLGTRSLAASVLVHASYNLLLFSLMLLGTGGFRNLDKM